MTAADATVQYGHAAPTFSESTSALQNSETIIFGLPTSSYTTTTAVGANPEITPFTTKVSGTATLSNYSITPVNGILTVTAAPLTVTASNKIKLYGSTYTFAKTEFTDAGLQNGETIGSVTLVSGGSSATAGVAGSPYSITPSSATGGTFNPSNYSTPDYVPGTLTVTPAPLSVKANNLSVEYGSPVPTFTDTVISETLYAGDAFSSAINTCNYTSTSPAGSYSIRPSNATGTGGFNDTNYTITYEDGILTVQPPTISVGSGGMTLGGYSLSNILPTHTAQLTIGSVKGGLNNPLTLSSVWSGSGLASVSSTGLNLGGVIRINGISAPAAGYGSSVSASGFTTAFGIPAPIWGFKPWVIIAPISAPPYAFKADAIKAGLATSFSALGWADGVVAQSNSNIRSAIVIDPNSLTALVNATTASNLSEIGSSGVASKSGIVSHGGPTGQGGTWNIGVNACGTSGFSVPGSSLQALIAATNGGQLVVGNGATIS